MRVKVFILIPTLGLGGAEKFVINLVNNIDHDMFDITLVVLNKVGRFKHFVSDDIQVLDLKVDRVRYCFPRIVSIIWKHRPHIVFSTMAHLNLMVACVKFLSPKSVKFICRETSIASVRSSQGNNSSSYQFFFKNLYKRFDVIVAQSQYMKNDLVDSFCIPVRKIKVINNFVNAAKNHDKRLDQSYGFDGSKTNLIFVGRLEKVKQVSILIQAVKITNTDVRLYIVGEGSEGSQLESLVRKIGLVDIVTFCGFVENPQKLIALSDYLILTSKYEGFPNVLLEANASGVPVVAFDCPGGVSEIIENGVNGILIKDQTVRGLARELDKLDQHTFLRGDPLHEFIERKFPRNYLIECYQNLFLACASDRCNSLSD